MLEKLSETYIMKIAQNKKLIIFLKKLINWLIFSGYDLMIKHDNNVYLKR